MRTARLTVFAIIFAFLCAALPVTATTNEELQTAAQGAISQALKVSGGADISFSEVDSSLYTDDSGMIAYYTKVDYSVNGESKSSNSTVVIDTNDQMRLVFLSIDAKYYGDAKESDSTLSLYIAKRGDKNDTVKSIQEVLVQLGFLDGTADGEYGAGTERAVKKFLAANDLPGHGSAINLYTYDKLMGAAVNVAPEMTEEVPLSTNEEAITPNSAVVMNNTELGLIEEDEKWLVVAVNLESGEMARTGDSFVLKESTGSAWDSEIGTFITILTNKNGQEIRIYEDDKLGVYFPADDETKAYIAKGETIIYQSKHPEYMDARGYIGKGVTLYFEDDEDTLTPLMKVKDIAYNTIKDGIASGYLLKVNDLELKKTYWQDGDFLLNTYAKNAGHPLWYIKVEDKNRKKTEEVIDYEFKGSWRSLRSGIKEGVAVYMGEGQNKVYQFDVKSYNKDTNELYVKYPGGSVELKNYDALVNGRGLYVLD